MIPLPITVEDYANHFPPAPDYLLLKRMAVMDPKRGSIFVPDNIVRAQAAFTTVAKVLSISEHKSEDPFIEQMKSIYRQCNYVGFSTHTAAEVMLMEEFRITPEEETRLLILLHVKDVVQIPKELDGLLLKHAKFQDLNSNTTLKII